MAGVFEREHGFGLGVDARFEGIEAGIGFALGGTGSGGFFRVAAVGFELFNGRPCIRVLSGHTVAGGGAALRGWGL